MLFLVIDDHSCDCRHAQFYPDQNMPRLEHCTRQALAKAGIRQAVYAEARRSTSPATSVLPASPRIQVILGRRRNPAGRGKVERLGEAIRNVVFPELRLLMAQGELTREEASAYLSA